MQDNKVVYAPTGFVNQTQLAGIVKEAVSSLGDNVVRLRYSVGTDTAGDPAIFFRVVLSDAASREHNLSAATSSIIDALFDKVRPYENWGLVPYVSFRSNSEQSNRDDPEWA